MHLTGQPPQLAPGLRVVRRGLDRLQVGLYDDRRVLLPRTEQVERTLSLLLQGHPQEQPWLDDPATSRVLDRLEEHGCLSWGRPARRRAPRVALLGRLDVPGLPDVGTLLAPSGATIVPAPAGADVVLVLSDGELSRDRLDDLIRRRVPHLVVRLVDGGAVLGPFVVPGATACLRCIDAHRSVLDPDHVAVTARYVRATSTARADGVPDLADPTLVALAVAWAVRDVSAHLDGREPSTWSRTVFLDADPSRRREDTWLRHPECGCCWSADVSDPPGTDPTG